MAATRNISDELLAAIASESQTLAGCILITPKIGAAIGFTTHDEDITFDGQTYYTDPGLTATEMVAVLTYAVDNLEISGAIDDDRVRKTDVQGGVYDDADYSIIVIDYEAPEYGSMTLQTGTIGEVETIDEKWAFDLRSLAQKLQQTVGETTSPLCRASVFDARCKLDENASHPTLAIPYKYTGLAVTEVVSRFAFKVEITSHTVPAGFFEMGLLVWESGDNEHQKSEVKTHTVSGTTHTITLQEPARTAFQLGDTLRVRKGCKKRLADCLDVGNVVNKRSEDHLPGFVETQRRPT